MKNNLDTQTVVQVESVLHLKESKPKRTRRNEDQLLTDTIAALYDKIKGKLTKIEDEKVVVEKIFDALKPLRELEDLYRGYDGK